MNNITFEQLPQAVSMLIEKVGLLTDKVEKVLGMTPQQHGECRTLLTLNEVAALLGKSASTIYAMTSDKRIPYHKRGNKLYFFQNEIIAWIEQGGTSGVASENEIERRLEELRNGKKRKPGALTDGNSRMSASSTTTSYTMSNEIQTDTLLHHTISRTVGFSFGRQVFPLRQKCLYRLMNGAVRTRTAYRIKGIDIVLEVGQVARFRCGTGGFFGLQP